MMNNAIYGSILLLSLKAFQASTQMTLELAKMSTASIRASTLSFAAESDSSISKEYTQQSSLDRQRAETLQTSAEEHKANANNLQEKNEITKAELATEESTLQSEREKAIAETIEATKDHAKTESDAVSTGLCEWVPFLDVVCDVVGGASAATFESNAARLTSQSVEDYEAASSTQTGKERTMDNYLTQQSNEAEEVKQGMEEEYKAGELRTKAETEHTYAEQEAGKAEEEEMEYEEEMKRAAKHGLMALRHGIVAATLSLLSLAFFVFRLVILILIPLGIEAVTIIAFLPQNVEKNDHQRFCGYNWATARSIWDILPKQEASYLILHGLILYLTMIMAGSRVCGSGRLDVNMDGTAPGADLGSTSISTDYARARGGIILIFAITAAAVQSALLHSIPRILVQMRTKSLESMRNRISSVIGSFFHAMLYLVPLFVMELVELWLLFGNTIFSNQNHSNLHQCSHYMWYLSLIGMIFTFSLMLLYIHSFYNKNAKDPNFNTDANLISSLNDIKEIIPMDERASLLDVSGDVESKYGGFSFLSRDSASMVSIPLTEPNESERNGLNSEQFYFGPSTSPIRQYSKRPFVLRIQEIVGSGDNESDDDTGDGEPEPSSSHRKLFAHSRHECDPLIINQFMNDLKVPFEVFVMTCMFVKVRECALVVWTLASRTLLDEGEGHDYGKQHHHSIPFLLKCTGVLLFIITCTWCLVSLMSPSSQRYGGHGGIWTGRITSLY